MTTPWIDIRNACVYRGETLALNRVSLAIHPGEHTVILGPNGCGKSTLLGLLTRQFRHVVCDDAYVRLFGLERETQDALRSKIGVVSHLLAAEVDPRSAGFNVVCSGLFGALGRYAHHTVLAWHEQRTEAVMAEVGIGHLGEKPFGAMSTGERQQCLIARALVHDPKVLILDEPSTGLDIKNTALLLHTLRTLATTRTVLLVTHHIHEIVPEIQRVALMQHGKMMAVGDKATILTSARLSQLYDFPVQLHQQAGAYWVLPSSTHQNP
jgi:iron complex transport system ATP-binding protein